MGIFDILDDGELTPQPETSRLVVAVASEALAVCAGLAAGGLVAGVYTAFQPLRFLAELRGYEADALKVNPINLGRLAGYVAYHAVIERVRGVDADDARPEDEDNDTNDDPLEFPSYARVEDINGIPTITMRH